MHFLLVAHKQAYFQLRDLSIFGQKTKQKQQLQNRNSEVHIFSNTQEGKIRLLGLHKEGYVISCSYFCIESNALCLTKTSPKDTFSSIAIYLLCKNARFWNYDSSYMKQKQFHCLISI